MAEASPTPGGVEVLGADVDLSALITSAVRDEHPKFTLDAILHAITNNAVASNLDALHVVPVLVGVAESHAGEILSLLAECGNAKESVISAQESLEHLAIELDSEDTVENAFIRLQRLLQLYGGAIPRIKLRKRTASDTLRPLFAGLPGVVERVSGRIASSEGREVIQLLCTVIRSAVRWAEDQEDASDVTSVKVLCKDVLLSSLTSLAPLLEMHLAQKKFRDCFPRLFRSRNTSCEEEDESLQVLINDIIANLKELSITYKHLLDEHSMGGIVPLSLVFSNDALPAPSPNVLLSDLFAVLIAALQSQFCLDSCLYIILRIAFPPATDKTSSELDPERVAPIIYATVPIASTSEDPTTRHISFRIIGTLLSKLPSFERLHVLHDILVDSPFPSIRVSGVGLLKEAMLEGLAITSAKEGIKNPFASPILLQTFGPVVLLSDPHDLFEQPANDGQLTKFLDSQEPRRLVECLGFYYILLLRDQKNQTGVRDPSQMKSVEHDFLSPLRSAIKTWMGSQAVGSDEHALMALAALETALERVDDARAKLEEETASSR